MTERLSDYDFELPEALIAQTPLAHRDGSRLLVLSPNDPPWAHRQFRDLPSLLNPGDLLVINNARVIPARLLGHKVPSGGKVELLLVRPASNQLTSAVLASQAEAVEWICLGQASKGLKPGVRLRFQDVLEAEVLEGLGAGEYRVRFFAQEGASLAQLLEQAGRLPLPPYISREPEAEDAERYQTIYARASGAVAAPTAGLHFTKELFAALAERGVGVSEVTLDVGPGTFLPVREEVLDAHHMHPERFFLSAETVEAVRATKAKGGRVVAVGTTVVRTLEAATDPQTGRLQEGAGETRLFIRPGFPFRQVDALLTNFHLPRSTLVMLVSAFAGKEETFAAYREAVQQGYRFFSYGDAMLISESRCKT